MSEKYHDFITTYSGKKVYLDNINPDDILLEDIIHHLSMICRFNGAVKYHYSVLQHSIILAAYIYHETNDVEQTLSALFHDASEAYICDIPRPFKHRLGGYKELEKQFMDVILQKFNIQPPSEEVLKADHNIVANEAKCLFKTVPDWVNDYELLDIVDFIFDEVDNNHVIETFKEVYVWFNEKRGITCNEFTE